MAYLRMFLGDQQVDAIFISEIFLESALGNKFIEVEKVLLLQKHAVMVQGKEAQLFFDVDPPMKAR
jgi:hypothetical protein